MLQITPQFGGRRNPALVVHTLPAMLRQRIVGMACGYESIADHDQLRNDPVLGVLGGSLTSKRSNCAALARKSTLNGLECRPDLVVRFGYGPSLPRSLRRPVESVMATKAA